MPLGYWTQTDAVTIVRARGINSENSYSLARSYLSELCSIVEKTLHNSGVTFIMWILYRRGGGDLAQSLPVCVVTKWRDMGSFLASREWEVYTYMGMFLQR